MGRIEGVGSNPNSIDSKRESGLDSETTLSASTARDWFPSSTTSVLPRRSSAKCGTGNVLDDLPRLSVFFLPHDAGASAQALHTLDSSAVVGRRTPQQLQQAQLQNKGSIEKNECKILFFCFQLCTRYAGKTRASSIFSPCFQQLLQPRQNQLAPDRDVQTLVGWRHRKDHGSFMKIVRGRTPPLVRELAQNAYVNSASSSRAPSLLAPPIMSKRTGEHPPSGYGLTGARLR